ncbi:hypothetical protein INT47_012155 [Mucor saturninus]|uniref:Transposase domain-containing protein n=1 Tax=Mucor saturninus TaxID=64648 RepID=A0A8H7QFI8_9FUNG|nr:hypothetical protein INT47_012155 [Mucor saturninus]
MSSSNSIYNTKCYCTVCGDNEEGFTYVTRRTVQHHNKRARVDAVFTSSRDSQREMMEVDSESVMTYQPGPVEEGGQTNVPVLEIESMPANDVSIENRDDDNEISVENDDGASDDEDVVELELEELDAEAPFEAPGMPENPVHKFIAIFTVLFTSRYVVNKGSIVLIEFINELLKIYEQDFQLPTSLLGLQRMTGFSEISKGIHRFVACQDCHQIYDECMTVPPTCVFQKLGSNSVCGCKLVKESSVGALAPKRVFVYQSVKHAMKTLFLRPGFEARIRHWNSDLKIPQTMCDVYDGAMWKDVKDINGAQFTADPRSLMLALNIDWFQPFDGVVYSCGAIYLVINNLPREERFKPENTILVGLMPGPKEPKSEEINHYLEPLVDELNELYVGMNIPTFERPTGASVRAALMMVACDIPAARKTSGFTAHNSTCACYKCNHQFSRLEGTTSVDFRGFEFAEWRLASGAENRVHAEVWKSASTSSERHQLEVENGVRWSQLHRLGYFDLVRGTIIDPMHNLFLGTAKRMVEKWTASGLIVDRDLREMQKIAETMVLPVGYSMLKTKIGKGFPRMKADEWKSWVLVYSPVLLKYVLPPANFANWIDFVDACRILVKPTITYDDVESAHLHLQQFCQSCETLYPATILTCNMHLHLHLRDTVRDFGPVYGYWLFGFERFNGLLKNINTNRRDGFEMTYMRNFLEDAYKSDYVNAVFPNSSQVLFSPVLQKLTSTTPTILSSPSTTYCTFDLQDFLRLSNDATILVKGNEPLPPSAFPLLTSKPSSISDVHYPFLLEYYKKQYDIPDLVDYRHASLSPFFVDNQIGKLKSIDILGQTYVGKNSSVSRGSFVQALFLGRYGDHANAYTGQIQYMFTHSFMPPTNQTICSSHGIQHTEHVFAFVRWLPLSSDRSREDDGVDICLPEFSDDDYQCILPVHRILLEVATAKYTKNNETTTLVIPLPKKQYA